MVKYIYLAMALIIFIAAIRERDPLLIIVGILVLLMRTTLDNDDRPGSS